MNGQPTLDELETAFAHHAPVVVRFQPADTWGDAAVLRPCFQPRMAGRSFSPCARKPSPPTRGK
ncbi:hypothetical protein ARMA_0364 [Ardenticatena maritima]|uniref:Uncharacterized protein n=1 Tax=Ardenticatena maritima TaxID=872965 RepID=A0A0M8K6V6_9CHLR|nr:hypothetical protein [Ardenticatena maritima]GAP61942.1 hypothetical protein ARMA_0364 [Ardenticatena maritima]